MHRSRRTLALITGAALALIAPTTSAGTAQGASTDRIISYHGYRVAVPANWQVVELAKDPTACIRFDRPTVYLGQPAEQQDCPAHLVGRTEGLVIQPLTASKPSAAAVVAPAGTAKAPAVAASADHQIQVAVEQAGVLVTAIHGAGSEATVRKVLDTARLTGGGTPAKLVRAAQPKIAAAGQVVAPGTMVNLQAFDQCNAPSVGAMNAWKASPFRAVGIYISGASRTCWQQPNLTPDWISANANNGWSFIPIDVGPQAPCGTRQPLISYDQATARNQGAQSADTSVAAALKLGIGPGSAIYSDIENYPMNHARIAECRDAILSYIKGWTERIHQHGFVSGVYGSSGSLGVHLSAAAGNPNWLMPDHLWFARWNGVANTDGKPYIPDGLWTNHQRLHQYRGDHNETWGGVTINIDSNFLDVSASVPPPLPNGTYRIQAEAGGYDLDITNCQSHNGADVRMWDSVRDSPCQKWRVENVSGNTFRIIDGNTNKPLQVTGCSDVDASHVTISDADPADCHAWTIEPIANGAYKVINTKSGDSLDVGGCSATRGADVIIWPFHGGTCQRWYFTKV